MDKHEIIASIKVLEADLRQRGVVGVGLFGSVARDEATHVSDIDVLLDVLKDEGFSLLDLIHIKNLLAEHLGYPVDVTTSPVRSDELAKEIGRDFIRAF